MKPKEVWLVDFVFADISGSKIRPGLIISKSEHNKKSDSVILCSVTTNPNRKSVPITKNNLSSGKMYEDSFIAYDTILSVDKDLLKKKIFVINDETFEKVKKELSEILF